MASSASKGKERATSFTDADHDARSEVLSKDLGATESNAREGPSGSQSRALSPQQNLEDEDEDNPHRCQPGQAAPQPKSRLQTLLDKHLLRHLPTVSLTLENSGSVARDHLASERTFLAYVRTSLAISSAGVALVQLFTIATARSGSAGKRIQEFARPLGAVTILLGLVVLLIGGQRYFTTQSSLVAGQFPVARKTIVFLSALLTCLIAVTFGILVAIPS